METIIWVAIAAGCIFALWKFWPKGNGLDVNKDGKVDLQDAKAGLEVVAAKVEEEVKAEVKKVATKAKTAAKKAADVNKDGKVDKADAKAAAGKVKAAVKKAGRPKKSA